MSYSLIKFDTEKYNFIRIVEDLLGVDDLSSLDEVHEELFKVGDDSKTSYHHKFYDKYHSGWPEMENMYEKFIAEVIAKEYNEDFLYQRFPTARFHLKNNLAVGAFHTDAEFGHPIGENNYIIPLTNARDTASVWIISGDDFIPMTMLTDHLIQFNGNQLRHGNRINKSGRTRVSMDFRVLPISKYDEANTSQSVTLKTKFKEGEYYKKFSKCQI